MKFICLWLECVIAIMLVSLGLAHRDAISISTVCYLNLSEHFIYFRHCEVAGIHIAQTQPTITPALSHGNIWLHSRWFRWYAYIIFLFWLHSLSITMCRLSIAVVCSFLFFFYIKIGFNFVLSTVTSRQHQLG